MTNLVIFYAVLNLLFFPVFGRIFTISQNEYPGTVPVEIDHVSELNIPPFWNEYEYNKNFKAYYKLHLEKQTWGKSSSQCIKEDAHLVVPQSAKEYDFIVTSMKEHSLDTVAVGIHDLFTEGKFVTVDDMPLNNIYHMWNSNGNRTNDQQDCVGMTAEGLDNILCSDKNAYICKKSLKSITTDALYNPLCGTSDPDYFDAKDLGSCYKLHKQPNTWLEAVEICRKEGAVLPIINGEKEAIYLLQKLSENPVIIEDSKFPDSKSYILLGFHDQFEEKYYITMDGKSLNKTGYTTWKIGEPNNGRSFDQNGENCGSLCIRGGLNDIPCTYPYIFFCERRIQPPRHQHHSCNEDSVIFNQFQTIENFNIIENHK